LPRLNPRLFEDSSLEWLCFFVVDVQHELAAGAALTHFVDEGHDRFKKELAVAGMRTMRAPLGSPPTTSSIRFICRFEFADTNLQIGARPNKRRNSRAG
jgi:hypothetical protein